MLIGSQQRLDKIFETPRILYGEHQIKRVREKTVLGLIIDDQLKWNRHNDEQCKKISKSIALLRKGKEFASQEELVTIYNSLVLPHFNYCSLFGMIITNLISINYGNYKRELHGL